ncbi:hypothetical protein [Citrobacter sp. wls826]|uniref:hypothetical protein n=1 Tax=Citrobacter sp. wls826 TaxID=2576415 RepID=UPI0010C93AF6|nr:hypothetical protein [Citrobacter sp. wls826]TKU26089.1 hypothetical protein FDW87_00010 [Citrobacter sp. wls826]TKV30135.1 hypothetical protein FDX20_27375 [Citrobacter sp. TBCS-11]
MPDISISVSISGLIQDRANAYHNLAQKATGTGQAESRHGGVITTLMRFFDKLDFLLQYGHLPTREDTAASSLPDELRGLKAFLEGSSEKDKCYTLQKDTYTRYRFTRSDGDNITVTEERFHPSLAGARTGYAYMDPWRKSVPQTCKSENLLAVLGGAWESTRDPLMTVLPTDDCLGGVETSPEALGTEPSPEALGTESVSEVITDVFSAEVTRQMRSNQEILQSIQKKEGVFILDKLIIPRDLQDAYCPSRGHKFTVGDVSGSPIAILLAGFASGALKLKEGVSWRRLANVVKEYETVMCDFARNRCRPGWQKKTDDLAKVLIKNLSLVGSGLCKMGVNGLLFLGDNMNDRLDFNYLIQEQVISLLQSTGAVFLRGNHDSIEHLRGYNLPHSPEEENAQMRLKKSFPCALFVEKTNTLYTHNGVTVTDVAESMFVNYAFPGLFCRVWDPENAGASYGQQISNFINAHEMFYSDELLLDEGEANARRMGESFDEAEYINQIPTGWRPRMSQLRETCDRLSIKQVAGHEGHFIQYDGNATRINGIGRIDSINSLVLMPVATITGI